jgi:hypothetical protein
MEGGGVGGVGGADGEGRGEAHVDDGTLRFASHFFLFPFSLTLTFFVLF